jgi:hypothetical protein
MNKITLLVSMGLCAGMTLLGACSGSDAPLERAADAD